MGRDADDMRPQTASAKAHDDAVAIAQESVQQAILQLSRLSLELTTGQLKLTPTEVATMEIHLEAVVAQVATIGVCIRNHLASGTSWRS